MKNKYLFIVDPQNDFIEGGSLAVPGGKEALQRIVDSGILDEPWKAIFVTLDSHYLSHLGFGEPDTVLRRHLTKNIPKPTQWPPHCIVDTHGWEIYEPLQSKLISLGDKVTYIEKGMDDTKDAYSAFGEPVTSLVDGLPRRVKWMFFELWRGEEVEVYWSGLAEDYCVHECMKSIMSRDKDDKIKHFLLFDMTACINNHIVIENHANFMSTSYRP